MLASWVLIGTTPMSNRMAPTIIMAFRPASWPPRMVSRGRLVGICRGRLSHLRPLRLFRSQGEFGSQEAEQQLQGEERQSAGWAGRALQRQVHTGLGLCCRAADLDQCNGRFAVTPEYPNGTYHYVLTDAFPFIPRCWMGNPDSSFMRLKRAGMRGEIQNESDLPTVDFAALSDNSEAAVMLVQAQGGHPPRFLHGGRPPPRGLGSGHGPGFGSRKGGPPPGGRPDAGRGGRSPCSGS